MSFWRTLLFDEVGLHGLRSWKTGFFSLATASAVLAFPTEGFVLETYLRQAALSAFALAALILLCFGLARFLGSKAEMEWFFKNTVTVAALGLGLSFVLGSVFIFLGSVLRDETVTQAAFSLLPFYSFALFGWGVEKNSHIHGYRAYVLAAVAIALFVLLHFGLEELVV